MLAVEVYVQSGLQEQICLLQAVSNNFDEKFDTIMAGYRGLSWWWGSCSGAYR